MKTLFDIAPSQTVAEPYFAQYATIADMTFYTCFNWAVPTSFTSALFECAFATGDILYPSPMGYVSPWSVASTYLTKYIQVTSPPRGAVYSLHDSEALAIKGSSFVRNWASPIEIDIIDASTHSRSHRYSTQGRLYMLLWQGDVASLALHQHAPAIPMMASQLLKSWRHTSMDTLLKQPGPCWLMPYDHTNTLLTNKFTAVTAKCQSLNPVVSYLRPSSIGLRDDAYLPTSRIAVIAFPYTTIQEEIISTIEQALCEATGSNHIRLSAHGVFV